MEFSSIIFLRMAAVVFSLLLLVQLPRILASDLGIQSKVCGTDHVAYLNSHGYELFYINGDVVDKDVFCKALKVYYANNCVFEGHPGSNYCGLNLPLGMCYIKLLIWGGFLIHSKKIFIFSLWQLSCLQTQEEKF